MWLPGYRIGLRAALAPDVGLDLQLAEPLLQRPTGVTRHIGPSKCRRHLLLEFGDGDVERVRSVR